MGIFFLKLISMLNKSSFFFVGRKLIPEPGVLLIVLGSGLGIAELGVCC